MANMQDKFIGSLQDAIKTKNLSNQGVAVKINKSTKWVTRLLNGNGADLSTAEMERIAKVIGFEFSGGESDGFGGSKPKPEVKPDDPMPKVMVVESAPEATVQLTEAMKQFAALIGGVTQKDEMIAELIEKKIAPIRKWSEQFSPKADHFVVDIDEIKREVKGKTHVAFEDVLPTAAAKDRDGCRHNMLFVGPAGCGKTFLAAQIADALGLRFGFLSLTAGISEAHLIGRYIPTGEAGKFEYNEAAFVNFYTHGGVFLLDEFDAADPNVLVVVNAAIANGEMALPNGEVVKRHADFILIAAANTFGHGADRVYCGRNQLDAATLDRFSGTVFELDYDESLEKELGNAELVAWAHSLRKKTREAKIRRIVSTRFIFRNSDLIDSGAATLDKVKARFLADWSDQEVESVGERRKK